MISGAFTKKSRVIKGTKPLNKDIANLDYEFDSEAEWEEEEPGEGICRFN